MSTMTWEKIRDHHLGKVAYYTDENYPRAIQRHQAMADFITDHLAQPAQAVDVGAIREVLTELERVLGDQPGWRSDIDKLTHAIGPRLIARRQSARSSAGTLKASSDSRGGVSVLWPNVPRCRASPISGPVKP